MEILFDLEIITEENELIEILEKYPDIKDLTNIEIEEKIELLKKLGCNNRHINNIIVTNPYYLCRISSDIEKLINKLINLGFNPINILLDSNPFILNKDEYEIDEYINNRLKKNELLEDIIDDLETNAYLFEEI